MTCEDVRDVAADLALDELTGVERAAALHHLASCSACRALVTDLAAVADAVLLLAPSVEPPSGFEARVLERLEPDRPPRGIRIRFAVGVAVAAAAAVVGGIVGSMFAGVTSTRSLPLAAQLTSTSGAPAGNVLVADHPDRMTCVFESERFGGAYVVQVVLDDGAVVDVGDFEAEGAPWSWTVDLPVDATDVRTVLVRDGDGVLRASAELD